ncbi:unnamed protein product [Lampetra fluviatilis]
MSAVLSWRVPWRVLGGRGDTRPPRRAIGRTLPAERTKAAEQEQVFPSGVPDILRLCLLYFQTTGERRTSSDGHARLAPRRVVAGTRRLWNAAGAVTAEQDIDFVFI